MNYNRFEAALLAQCKKIGVPEPKIQPGDVAGSFSKNQGSVEIFHDKNGRTVAEVVRDFSSNDMKRKVVTEYIQHETQIAPDGSETIIKRAYHAGEKTPFFEGFSELTPKGKLHSWGLIMEDGTREPVSAKPTPEIDRILAREDYVDLLFGETDPSLYFRLFDI